MSALIETQLEVGHALSFGHLPGGRHICSPAQRNTAHAMPAVQPWSKEETRSLPKRDVQTGRRGLALLALRLQRGSVL